MKSNEENQRKILLIGILFSSSGFLGIGLQFFFQHNLPRFDDWVNYLCSAFFSICGLTLVAYVQQWVSILKKLLPLAILQFFAIFALIIFKPGPMTCTYQSGNSFLTQSGLACRIPLGLILLVSLTMTGVAYYQNRNAISDFFERE